MQGMLMLSAVAALLAVGLPAAAASPERPAPLVSYEQTGGFAGIERGLVVYRSGKVVSDGLPLRTSRLSPERLRTLRALLVNAKFATLRREYESKQPIADGFVFRIAHAGRVIRIEQGAKPPLRLARVERFLRGLTRL